MANNTSRPRPVSSRPIRPVRSTMSSRPHANRSHRPNFCLHLITFGSNRGSPEIPLPVILHLDLSTSRPPSRDLLERYTGASPQIAAAFFSVPGHKAYYQSVLETLRDQLIEVGHRRGGCVAVLLNCRAGMHRSVAVAERLAGDVESWRWRGVRVVVEHLDTDIERGIRRERRARAGRRGSRRQQGGEYFKGYQSGYGAGRYGGWA